MARPKLPEGEQKVIYQLRVSSGLAERLRDIGAENIRNLLDLVCFDFFNSREQIRKR